MEFLVGDGAVVVGGEPEHAALPGSPQLPGGLQLFTGAETKADTGTVLG